jgi:2C-methyl-D-erythritol 2,4-cyclodiphosphate synthase
MVDTALVAVSDAALSAGALICVTKMFPNT